MDNRQSSVRALVVVLSLLLVALLIYGGSYFALVEPQGSGYLNGQTIHYRFVHTQAEYFYWPLEQMDRWIRPRAWQEIHWSPPA